MHTESTRLERLPAVLARTGMSRSWIYKEIAARRFPAPIKVGAASVWNAADIDGWLEALLASSRRTSARGA